jgi:transposase
MDGDTGMIMASTLTGNDIGDPSQVAPLLDQIEATIASVTADGAYDGMPTYDAVASHGEDVQVIIRPV